MRSVRRPTICLSASGGGHLRQLLDIEALWSRYPHFFVTEDTILARSLAASENVETVPHFALGQSRMGKLLRMIRSAIASSWQSLRIIRRYRPDVVISTGAGSQVFVLAWARLFGARIIMIESFARFSTPSKFARIAGPLAHLRIAQSSPAAKRWRNALVFDPLVHVPARADGKEDLIFVTVGAILPFDRLTAMVVALKQGGRVPEQVVIQTGRQAQPLPAIEGVTVVEELSFGDLRDILRRARVVVSHAGTGSLVTALEASCHVVAVPRSVAHHDSYDDHQYEIARNFEVRGLIQVAENESSLDAALVRTRSLAPRAVRMDHSALVRFLESRLAQDFPEAAMAERLIAPPDSAA